MGALDSCLDFEQEQNPRGKKRFFWEMLSTFVSYFSVFCLVFVKAILFIEHRTMSSEKAVGTLQ